jgi:hypothetical protein
MSVLNKIIPFYGIIEDAFKTAGEVAIKKTEGSENRKNMSHEAEVRVYIQTEYEKRISEIKQSEQSSEQKRNIEIMEKKAVLADMPGKLSHERQLEYEQHRMEMFEKFKRLEVEIGKEISIFDINTQKEITNWQNIVMSKLDNEILSAMTDKLPKMISVAQQFKDDPDIYTEYKKKALGIVTHIENSIYEDKKLIRSGIASLHERQDKRSNVLIEMAKKFDQIGNNKTALLE